MVAKRSILAVLLCVHCSVTVLAGAVAIGAAVLPTVFGVSLGSLFIPAVLVGGVVTLLWLDIRAREKAAACEMPEVLPPERER